MAFTPACENWVSSSLLHQSCAFLHRFSPVFLNLHVFASISHFAPFLGEYFQFRATKSRDWSPIYITKTLFDRSVAFFHRFNSFHIASVKFNHFIWRVRTNRKPREKIYVSSWCGNIVIHHFVSPCQSTSIALTQLSTTRGWKLEEHLAQLFGGFSLRRDVLVQSWSF